MKKLLLVLSMAGAIRTTYSQQNMTNKLDELLTATANAHRYNGSVLVSMNGKILLQKGYGWKNKQDSLLNDTATIYQIASATKQFTATLILKLAELKKLSLNDKVSRFYPAFRKGDSITIENLLTHTSGIDDQLYSDPSKPLPPQQEVLTTIENNRLAFVPGTQFMYSNKGYQLLGYIIQRVTGMSYYQAVRKYIFTPLKMTHSGFDFFHLANKDKASGYYYMSDTTCPPAPIIDSSASFSAGSIYSTVGDLYKWLEGINSYRIISKASLGKAYTPSADPHYGYGRQIDTFFNRRVISHGGDIWGFKSKIASIPEDDVCIVLLENKEEGDNYILQKIIAILYGQPYQLPAKNEIVLGREILEKYTGSYEMQPGVIIEVTLENTHLIATAGNRNELYTLRRNFFILDDGYNHLQIEFGADENGAIINLSFLKKGKKIICKKIR